MSRPLLGFALLCDEQQCTFDVVIKYTGNTTRTVSVSFKGDDNDTPRRVQQAALDWVHKAMPGTERSSGVSWKQFNAIIARYTCVAANSFHGDDATHRPRRWRRRLETPYALVAFQQTLDNVVTGAQTLRFTFRVDLALAEQWEKPPRSA